MDEGSDGGGPRILGRELVTFEALDSTNAEALRRAEGGAAEGLVVVAQTQTAGRGRSGRRWLDRPGDGLLFSVLLRPRLTPVQVGVLPLAMGLGMATALRETTGVAARVKWPNDVVVLGGGIGAIGCHSEERSDEESRHSFGTDEADGEIPRRCAPRNDRPNFAPRNDRPNFALRNDRPKCAHRDDRPKCALRDDRPDLAPRSDGQEPGGTPRYRKLVGILVEQAHGAVVVGIGVNVNGVPGDLPPEAAPTAVSLAELTGAAWEPASLLPPILARCEESYLRLLHGGAGEIIAAFAKLDICLGREVTVHAADGVTHARAVGIAPNGSLIIEDTEGQEAPVYAADVSLRLA